jgi:hypothetical protein
MVAGKNNFQSLGLYLCARSVGFNVIGENTPGNIGNLGNRWLVAGTHVFYVTSNARHGMNAMMDKV